MGFDNNEMMVELFRSEVESHSDALSNALLVLEKHPDDTSQLVAMMRAAHSIKGAARIVGVPPAVEVAHALEDCFVAAQRGELQIESQHVDLLLSGVDLLARIAQETKSPNPNWNSFQGDVERIVAGVGSILTHEPMVAAGLSTKPQSKPQIAPPREIAEMQSLAAPPSPDCVEVAASLNRIECERLRTLVLNAVANRVPSLTFDLSKTPAIEPIGVAFLAACQTHLAQHDASLQIRNPLPTPKALLSVCGLGNMVVD